MRIRFAVLACAIVATGCTLFTGPRSQLITLSVTSDTLAAFVNPNTDITWLQFTIPVSVHNGSSSAVTVDECLATVQTANGTVAWAPICFDSALLNPPTLAPGATATYQWTVVAAISGPGGPKWGSPTIDGTYRLNIALDANAALISNEFAISVLTTSAAAANPVRSRAEPRLAK